MKEKMKKKVLLVSLLTGIVVLILKVYSVYLTGSVALKSDALESVVNIVASFFALGAVVFAGRPADQEHPYGHGKIENFSAVFEGGLIAVASCLIIYDAIHKLFVPTPIHSLNLGLLVNFVAGAINGLLGWMVMKEGKRYNSKALEADGRHLLSDFYTTIGVAAGLILMVVTGKIWMDSIVALLVGLMLAYTGFNLIKDSWNALMDREDPKIVAEIIEALLRLKPEDVIDFHNLKVLRSGSYFYIDIHLVVPEYYNFRLAHDISKGFTKQAILEVDLEGEFHIHIDPCDKTYCASCSIGTCKIRSCDFKELPTFSVDHVTSSRSCQLAKSNKTF